MPLDWFTSEKQAHGGPSPGALHRCSAMCEGIGGPAATRGCWAVSRLPPQNRTLAQLHIAMRGAFHRYRRGREVAHLMSGAGVVVSSHHDATNAGGAYWACTTARHGNGVHPASTGRVAKGGAGPR